MSATSEQAETPEAEMTERFTISKIDGPTKKPWTVEDTACDRAADPVLYRFSSERKALTFKIMLEAETTR